VMPVPLDLYMSSVTWIHILGGNIYDLPAMYRNDRADTETAKKVMRAETQPLYAQA
jgi:hypothetical protein